MTQLNIEFDTQGAINSLNELREAWQQAKPDTTPVVKDNSQWNKLYKCPHCGGYGKGNWWLSRHEEGNHKLAKKAKKLQSAYALRDEEAIFNTQMLYKSREFKAKKAEVRNLLKLMKAEIDIMKGIGNDILDGRQIF